MPDEELRKGTLITSQRQYRLEQWIGSGAFGDVWKATHLFRNKAVALKLLKPHIARENPRVRDRFAEGV